MTDQKLSLFQMWCAPINIHILGILVLELKQSAQKWGVLESKCLDLFIMSSVCTEHFVMWTNRAIKFASHNPLFFSHLASICVHQQSACRTINTHPAQDGRRLKHPELMIIIMFHLFNSSCYSFIAPVHLHRWHPYVMQLFCLVVSGIAWAILYYIFLVFAKDCTSHFLRGEMKTSLNYISQNR